MKAPSVKPVRCAIYTRVSTARPLQPKSPRCRSLKLARPRRHLLARRRTVGARRQSLSTLPPASATPVPVLQLALASSAQAASKELPAGFHSMAFGLDGSGAVAATFRVRTRRLRRGEFGWSSWELWPCRIRSARSRAAVKKRLSPSNFNSSGMTLRAFASFPSAETMT